MKTILSLVIVSALAGVAPSTTCRAADQDGVALAIIYDTSGSMHDAVCDASGQRSPKYVIANRALKEVSKQIQAFAERRSQNTSWQIQVGLFVFQGDGARMAVPFGPFDAQALEHFADTFSTPSGNTPLGNALNTAARTVLNSPLPRKHVLIITDGVNTAGRPPAAFMPALKQQADRKQTSLSIHFVAFDVDAKVFSEPKKLGATVVGAADEKQLDSQLEYILQRKILLEEEETPAPKR
jgi:hypothetical protein